MPTTVRRVDPLSRSWSLHDTAATRAIERAAQAQLAPHALMRRAGAAVADLALALAPHARRIWILAGPGNNGGDGLEAAHWLARSGKRLQVRLLADPARQPADARDALNRAMGAGVPIESGPLFVPAPDDLVIDALLGIGGSRAPAGDLAAAIMAINAAPCPVLAIDVPSGLDADTGRSLGVDAVRARHTLTLLTLKPGLYTGEGRDHAGTAWFDALGLDTVETSRTTAPSAWLSGHAPTPAAGARPHASHKGSFGDVLVVGGATGMVGAALLAGRAALASGAGRVYLGLLCEEAFALDSARPELMLRPPPGRPGATAMDAATVLCGCGGGDAVGEVLQEVLDQAPRLVLDADALNAVAHDAACQQALAERATHGRATVLTPHPLEAARLLGCHAAEVQRDRLAAARSLASRFQCVVVLKGSGTVVAAPGAVPCINPTGTAALATAGTGDVLAGWIAGRWAQGKDAGPVPAMDVAAEAVFRHGLAAEGVKPPLRAAELIERMYALDQ